MKPAAYLLFPAFVAALLFTSCVDGLKGVGADSPYAGEKECIELRLGSAPLSVMTKRGHEQGVGAYNESLIESVDLFFYPEGGTGSNASKIVLGRGVEQKTWADSVVFYVSVHYTPAEASALFGSVDSGTCEVFAIANANLTYGNDTKVATLKNMIVERDFPLSETQGSFVMSSEDAVKVYQQTNAAHEPYATTKNPITGFDYGVPMRRAAAKAQLFLRFPEQIAEEASPNTIWKPDLAGEHHSEGVYVDLLHISKKGRIDAPYVTQPADYASYERQPIYKRNTLPASTPAISSDYDDYDWACKPFYSYPISWSDVDEYACVYLIHVPWYMAKDEGVDVVDPYCEYRTYQVNANVLDLRFERNHCYRSFVHIRSLGGVDAAQIIVIPECDYYICPWNLGSDSGGGVVAGSFSDYKYLVVDNPEETLNNEETVRFSYMSSSKISSVNITKIVYYCNREMTTKQEVTAGQSGYYYQNSSDNRSTINFNNLCNKIGIDYTTNPGIVTMTHSLTDVVGRYGQFEVWADVTNADGITESVHFVQNPSIRLECNYTTRVGNVFVDGFFAKVRNASFGTPYSQNNQYNSYWSGQWYASNAEPGSGGDMAIGTVNGSNYNAYGYITGGTRSNENPLYTTEINVSSFSSGNSRYVYAVDGVSFEKEYRIGDPRIKASVLYPGWSLFPYLSNKQGNTYTTTNWDRPGDILIALQAPENQDFIAPRFLVSSNYNGAGTKATSFENTVKRAAVYQEAGYPAGRWRLPTEAEVAFIYARQLDGTIPTLYSNTSGNGYWVASGRRLRVSDTISLETINSDTGGISARFVYDLWYWGDEQAATNVYHPNGHNTSY